jgi:uncharacterized protein YodC (DUF2158 family)
MSTQFKKGDEVRVNVVTPQGAVQALRMDEDGTVYCKLVWDDANGVEQERWFAEGDLVKV